MTEPALWWPEEVEAWRIPERLTVSEWADRYRLLSPRTTAMPGPWRTDLVPFAREIMDAFSDPRVEEITFVASTQVSKTESWMNMLGWSLMQAPKSTLCVLPTDTDSAKLCRERLQPMLLENHHLCAEMTGDPDDVKLQELHLKRCTVYFASANSPSRLASMPVRYLFLDETDKFKEYSGREASPIKLARERTRTFRDRKIVMTCTPTTSDGYILASYAQSDKSRFWVPCPHCGVFQILLFKHIRFGDERNPERLLETDAAEYYCPHCGEAVDDKAKQGMLRRGVWVSEKYQQIDPGSGQVSGELPRVRAHRGFWINALYSPWLRWADIAAEFLRSKDNPQDLMNFTNSWLAEPWQDRVLSPEVEAILALRNDLAEGMAPAGTLAITAGIDVQMQGMWVTAWAWGANMAGHLLTYGFLPDWAALEEWLGRKYKVADGARDLGVWRACIDTGGGPTDEGWSRTEEVYEWIRHKGGRMVHGIKGIGVNATPHQRVRHTTVGKKPGTKAGGGMLLWLLDVNAFKDLLLWRLTRGHETGQPVSLHRDTTEQYARHVLAEEKRKNPRSGKMVWVQTRKDNHLLDASIYAHAAADPQFAGGVPGLLNQTPKRRAAPQLMNPAKTLW